MQNITTDIIIKTVCEALSLDRDKLLAEKRERLQKGVWSKSGMLIAQVDRYQQGRLIATKLIRENVVKKSGRTIPPTYMEISYIFKKKTHCASSNWETDCNKLLRKDENFKETYTAVVNLLNHNVSITPYEQPK